MADLNEYKELNGIELRPEVARLMELFAECWEECRSDECGTCKYRHGKKHYQMLLCLSERYAEKLIANDVAPVRHGRWIDRIVDENEVIQPWMKRYYCSECLEGGSQSWFKFCPNCGCRMDGG